MGFFKKLDLEFKVAIVMFAVGFGVSFILGLATGVAFFTVIARALISGVILGGISYAVYKIINAYVHEVIEEVSERGETHEELGEYASGENINILDEGLPVEEVIDNTYSNGAKGENLEESESSFTDLSDASRVVVENPPPPPPPPPQDVNGSSSSSFSAPSSTGASDFLMSGNSFSQISILSSGKSKIMGNSVIVDGKEIPNQPEVMAKAIRHVLKESD